MGLILIPASRENLEQSIEKSVDYLLAQKYISEDFLDEITKYSGLEGIRCWASTINNKGIFDNLQNGDEVLLTENGTGKFTHYGVIIGKIQNKEFGQALWSVVGDNPWEFIYFMANIQRIQIDKRALILELGYASNFTVPGAIRVREDYYKKIGAIASKLEIEIYNNVIEASVDNSFFAQNVRAIGNRRIGHTSFSKEVKKNYNYQCAMCGICEVEFLVAAHISAWAEDPYNRLNPKNGICLCSMHDKAFEHGYIGINDDFTVLLNHKIKNDSELYKLLESTKNKGIRLPTKDHPDIFFLKMHRAKHKLEENGN